MFVHDRVTGQTTLVSVLAGGGVGNKASTLPSIGADGRYVVFVSEATNLVAGDTNGKLDVFLRDRAEGTTTRVSVTDAGAQTAQGGRDGIVSPDGRFVLFLSAMPEYVPVTTTFQAYRYDRFYGTSTRVSVASTGAFANDAVSRAVFTADGSTIVFTSLASNLAPGDGNAHSDVFLRDGIRSTTHRVNLTPAGTDSGDFATVQALSDDGRVILFSSVAADLVADDTNAKNDLFVREDRPTVTSLSPRGGPSTGGTTVQLSGRGMVDGTAVSIGNGLATAVDTSNGSQLRAVTPAGVPGLADVYVTVPGFGSEGYFFAYTFVDTGAGGLDSDGDGSHDSAEAQFSLDLLDPADALADPDGDQRSNEVELAEGTHPLGLYTSYLAEGATGGFLSTELALRTPPRAWRRSCCGTSGAMARPSRRS